MQIVEGRWYRVLRRYRLYSICKGSSFIKKVSLPTTSNLLPKKFTTYVMYYSKKTTGFSNDPWNSKHTLKLSKVSESKRFLWQHFAFSINSRMEGFKADKMAISRQLPQGVFCRPQPEWVYRLLQKLFSHTPFRSECPAKEIACRK